MRRVVSVVDTLEGIFVLPLAPRWVRHSYLSKEATIDPLYLWVIRDAAPARPSLDYNPNATTETSGGKIGTERASFNIPI